MKQIASCRLATFQESINGARMHEIEHGHNTKHQNRIKNIQKYLMAHDVPCISLQIFNHSKDRSDENEGADGVQRTHVFSPGDLDRDRLSGRFSDNSEIENDTDENKKAEEEDLNYETANDDIRAEVLRRLGFVGHDPATYMLAVSNPKKMIKWKKDFAHRSLA